MKEWMTIKFHPWDVYGALFAAKKNIKKALHSKWKKYLLIWKIIEARLDDMLKLSLHSQDII